MDASLFALPFPPATLVAAAAIILLAYTVFGLTGFGSSITAAPFLLLLFPLRFAVPLMVILDLVSGTLLAIRNYRRVAWRELARLLPYAAAGMVLGVTLLVHAPERPLLLLLGVFILAWLAKAVFGSPRTRDIAPSWAAPLGIAGGIFTSLYGTGGPIYTIFLAGRVHEKWVLRATMGMLILLTALTRVGLFSAAGFYAQAGLLALSAALLPAVLAGLFLGSHLHHRLPAARVVQAIQVVLLVGALNLIRRSVSG
ncbi:MAG: sulfite exporter TauE/SafE family protein [Betaproteobacteria bacterium]